MTPFPFRSTRGDKIGLIAKNGSGKTTLLRTLAGEVTPEGVRPRILVAKHIRIAFLSQDPLLSLQSNHPGRPPCTAPGTHPGLSILPGSETGLETRGYSKQATLRMDDNKAWDFRIENAHGDRKHSGSPTCKEPLGPSPGGRRNASPLPGSFSRSQIYSFSTSQPITLTST